MATTEECPHGVEKVTASSEELAKVEADECPQCEGVKARPRYIEGKKFMECPCCSFFWRAKKVPGGQVMLMFGMFVTKED
jgi:hypothetical protein